MTLDEQILRKLFKGDPGRDGGIWLELGGERVCVGYDGGCACTDVCSGITPEEAARIREVSER